jgi:hypothetical protein
MNSAEDQVLPTPPRPIASFIAGFDVVTNHIALILFPVVLDLFLWFGPHLRISKLMGGFPLEITPVPGAETPDISTMIRANQEFWRFIGERINLFVGLRTYPVGIPSLMLSTLPIRIPNGSPRMLELQESSLALLLFISIVLVGIIFGTLYYIMVSQAVLSDSIQFSQVVRFWPKMSLHILILTLVWAVVLIGVSIPASCLISMMILGGLSLGPFAVLIFAGLILWALFPLFFSPHGIIVHKYSIWETIKAGIRLSNITLPTTGLFLIILILLSQGLDLLWRVPPEDSWLTILGVAGHGFVTTGLVASSFVYYRDSTQWIQGLKEQLVRSSN